MKSAWTFQQFATGVFRNLLDEAMPMDVDLRATHERIKTVGGMLNSAQLQDAGAALALCDLALDRAAVALLKADDQISASMQRRFFEKLKRQDDAIICQLIKFYLYADAVTGDRRDKLDFLFTRIGEDYVTERGEYSSRDSLEFRERVIALVSIRPQVEAMRDELLGLLRAIRSIREDLQSAQAIEEFAERHLLRNARVFKHRVGDLYFHPDVLLAIVELNVATKNRFLALYRIEEQRLLDDAQKLTDHAHAIERNFGDTNPELVEEIARFRRFKAEFDESRLRSNVKHDVIARLKASMSNILTQLDRGVAEEVEEVSSEIPAKFFDEAQRTTNVMDRFGREELLLPHLMRMAAGLDMVDSSLPPEQMVDVSYVRDLRLETWEVTSYLKLFARCPAESDEDNDELWMLYLRAAALRIKVDEEATILATAMAAGMRPEGELLLKAKQSLDSAKELDALFGDFLHEAVYYSNPRILHQLYRSRFRLLRGFSGLWLIYDRNA